MVKPVHSLFNLLFCLKGCLDFKLDTEGQLLGATKLITHKAVYVDQQLD